MGADDGRDDVSPGEAVEAFGAEVRRIGEWTVRQGVGVDVMANGLESVWAPVLQGLCGPSGGAVLFVHSWGPQACGRDLLRCLANQNVPPVQEPATLDINLSPHLQLLQVIGSDVGRLQRAAAGGEASGPVGAGVELRRVSCTSAVTLVAEGQAAGAAGFLQILVRHVDGDQRRLRIISHRLPVASEEDQLLHAIDEDVLAVVLAKRFIFHANAALQAGGACPVRDGKGFLCRQ